VSVVVSALGVSLALAAAEGGTEAVKPSRIRMPGHGALIFQVPAAWKVSAARPSEDLPPTIHFDPASGEAFSVQITPVWKGPEASEMPDPPKIRKMVEQARDSVAARATTSDILIRELSAGPVNGYYYSVTDKTSEGKPGDWRYMTQGSARFEDLVLAFTVLTNDPQQPEADATFAMFQTLQREPPSPEEQAVSQAAAQPPAHQEIKVALPDKPWALVLDLPGFKVEMQQVRPDRSGAMMQASNDRTRLIASAFVEREKKIDTVEECKKFYWGKGSKSPLRKTDVREVAKGEMIAVHYMIPEFQGIPAQQMNVNAYLYHDGTCIDVHLSKVKYDPEDEALFDAVLSSVHFADK
jgi:hypothetical protein